MAFEVVKLEDGSFRWHLRDEKGKVVKLVPGRIMLPRTRGAAAAERRSKAAVQQVLADLYRKQEQEQV